MDGKPVIEFHCAPSSKRSAPAVIILHVAGPRGADNADCEQLCESLAAHGYCAEFIEYYSQTGAVEPNRDEIKAAFPAWRREISSGISTLRENPSVQPDRIGLLGFSLGANIALVYAALRPEDVQAVVEYYGWLPALLSPRAAKMPPVLILQGAQDQVVKVQPATQLDTLLSQKRRPHEIKIYAHAGHGFNFDAPAGTDGTDAWQRTVRFFDKYPGGEPYRASAG